MGNEEICNQFSIVINNIVKELGVERAIKLYSEFGWSRKQIIHLIKIYVYPNLR